MARNLTLLFFTPFLSVACESDSSQDPNEDLIDRHVEAHPVDELPSSDSLVLPESFEKKFSGDWQYEGGVRICDGYLTRKDDEEFCEAEIPKDWQPFTYEGKTYYVQPLSEASE